MNLDIINSLDPTFRLNRSQNILDHAAACLFGVLYEPENFRCTSRSQFAAVWVLFYYRTNMILLVNRGYSVSYEHMIACHNKQRQGQLIPCSVKIDAA